jgi:hypothetical protein
MKPPPSNIYTVLNTRKDSSLAYRVHEIIALAKGTRNGRANASPLTLPEQVFGRRS